MSKCDLTISVDRDRVGLGETLSGDVAVLVNKDCKCNGLTLELVWQTRSRARTVQGSAGPVQLFAGSWRGGEDNRYPFRIPVPNGPCSYDGELLSVGWSLRARADIPWAIDPKAERPVRVEPAPVADYFAGPAYATPPPPAGPRDGRALVRNLIIAAVIAAVVGALLIDAARHTPALWAIPPGIVFLGALFSLGRIRRLLASRRIGQPEVSFEPQVAAPGQPVLIQVRLAPSKPLAVNAIRVKVGAIEKIIYTETYTSGGKTRTRRVTKTRSVVVLDAPVAHDQQALAACQPCTQGSAVDIPAQGPLTFAASDNWVFWQAEVHIDIAGWPDWKMTYPLAVLPPRAGADGRAGRPVVGGDGRIIG